MTIPQTELVSEGVLASNPSCPDLPKWPTLEYLASAFPRVLVYFSWKSMKNQENQMKTNKIQWAINGYLLSTQIQLKACTFNSNPVNSMYFQPKSC